VYYVLIISKERERHLRLRKVINKLLPQAIIESFFGDEETFQFLSNSNIAPHLILVEKELAHNNELNMMPLIRSNDNLVEVPVIMLKEGSEIEQSLPSYLGATELRWDVVNRNIDEGAQAISKQWSASASSNWRSASM
jgi:hypothetical protein